MGDISAHFDRRELECRCGCHFKACDIELLDILEDVRARFGSKPIQVHCACRCKEHNRNVGSKDTSQHVKGMAADFHIDGIDNQDIYDYLHNYRLENKHGLGIYSWGIHVDVRGTMKRWDER